MFLACYRKNHRVLDATMGNEFGRMKMSRKHDAKASGNGEVSRKRRLRIAALGSGVRAALTWDDVFLQYWEVNKPKDSDKPVAKYVIWSKLQQWLEYAKGCVADADATRQQVGRYLVDRLKDCSDKTVNNDRRYLSYFFAWLIRNDVVSWSYNPAYSRLHALPKPKRYTPESLSREVDEQLRSALTGTDLWPVYCLMRYAGLQLAEALRLRWPDVDLDACQMRIRGTPTIKGTHVIKGRNLPIGKTLKQALEGLPRSAGRVCVDSDSSGWCEHECLRCWRKVTGGMSVSQPPVDPDTVRNTCIKEALRRGMPPLAASRVFGQSMREIMAFYEDLTPEEVARYL